MPLSFVAVIVIVINGLPLSQMDHHCIVANGSTLLKMDHRYCQYIATVTIGSPLTPTDRHCHKWITVVGNVANGSLLSKMDPDHHFRQWYNCHHYLFGDPKNVINGYHWRSPLAPMMISIGANVDGVHHWRHWMHRHWCQYIAIGAIFVAIGEN